MKIAILLIIITIIVFLAANKTEIKAKSVTDKLLFVIAVEFAIILALIILMMLIPR